MEFRVASGVDTDSLVLPSETGTFDGAYSSFALSYERDLESVRRTLARAVRPEGLAVLALMNRCCAIEFAISAVALRPALAWRRLATATRHKVGEVDVLVYPRSAWEAARIFAPSFRLVSLRALPALVPPYYFNRPLKRWPALLEALERVDPVLCPVPIFRLVGDHTIITLRRNFPAD